MFHFSFTRVLSKKVYQPYADVIGHDEVDAGSDQRKLDYERIQERSRPGTIG